MLDTPAFNTFASPKTVDNYTHQTSLSRPKYDDNSIKLECQSVSNTSVKASIYSIQYPFKVGFRYKIDIFLKGQTGANDFYPNVGLKISNTNGGVDTSKSCSPPSQTTMSNATTFFQGSTGSNYAWTINFFDATITQPASYLLVGAFPWAFSTSVGTVWIRKIQIIEIPPTFTITPTTVQIACGTTVTKTFKVKNVNNVAGTVIYNWNLGSASNGWMRNGVPALQNFTTTEDSIVLTSTTPASSVSNVSANINFNGYNIPPLTSNVSSYTPLVNYNLLGYDVPCKNMTTTYTLQQTPPAGTSVTWSIYPDDGSITLTPSGTPTSPSVIVDASNVTPNVNYFGNYYNLTASVSGSCYQGTGTRQFFIPNTPFYGSVSGLVGWNTSYSTALVEGDNYLYMGGGANWFDVELYNYTSNGYFANGWWEHISGDYAAGAGPWYLHFDAYSSGPPDAYYDYHYTDDCGAHTFSFHFISSYSYPPSNKVQINNDPKYSLKISPNPANSFVVISVQDLISNINLEAKSKVKVFDYTTSKRISIYDKLGVLVLQQKAIISKSGLRLNVTGLRNNEMYNVLIEDEKGNRLSGKFMKF